MADAFGHEWEPTDRDGFDRCVNCRGIWPIRFPLSGTGGHVSPHGERPTKCPQDRKTVHSSPWSDRAFTSNEAIYHLHDCNCATCTGPVKGTPEQNRRTDSPRWSQRPF